MTTIEELITRFGEVRDQRLDDAEIVAFERVIGHQLPSDYRDFLSRCAGVLIDGRLASSFVQPDRLFAICDDEGFSLRTSFEEFSARLPTSWLPIGDDQSGGLICLQLEGSTCHAISIWNSETYEILHLANSFTGFVSDLRSPPPQTVDHYLEARAQFDSGDYKQARIGFEKSWSMEQHAHTAHWLAQTLERLGLEDQARRWHSRAYEMSPDHGMIAVGHAASLQGAARSAEAVAILQAVLDKNPTYGPARKLLEVLLKD